MRGPMALSPIPARAGAPKSAAKLAAKAILLRKTIARSGVVEYWVELLPATGKLKPHGLARMVAAFTSVRAGLR